MNRNGLRDDHLRPLLRQIFASEHCIIKELEITESEFSGIGKRTLLKGYSISPIRHRMEFRFGPLPFTEGTLKQAVAKETDMGTKKPRQ